MSASSISRFGVSNRVNAVVGWTLVGVLVTAALLNFATGRALDGGLALVIVGIALAPALRFRAVRILPPWEVICLSAVPLLADFLTLGRLTGAFQFGSYLAVAALALMLTIDLDLLTTVEMNEGFAIFFVVTTTMAAASVWALGRWFGGLLLGTTLSETLRQLMTEFIGATLAGGVGGLLFAYYFRRFDRLPRQVPASVTERLARSSGGSRRPSARLAPVDVSRSENGTDRRFLGLHRTRERLLTRVLQLGLVGILALGGVEGDTGIIVNAGVGLGITFLPGVLRRDYGVPLDVRLTLWITLAVFAHAVGTVRFPGSPADVYRTVWWWDHLTHTLSASVVAVVGYATVRAIEENSKNVLPPTFLFAFLLMMTLAFGVAWEILEFVVGSVSGVLGTASVLVQYGLADTMGDLLFDVVGAVLVATGGTVYLTDFTERLAEWWTRREG